MGLVSGLILFIISSDPQWMESDRWLYRDNSCSRELGGGGVKMGGGCNEVQTGFDARSYHPRGLSFYPDPVGLVGMVTLFQLRGVGIPG